MSAVHDRLQTDLQALIQGLDLAGTRGVTGDIGDNVFVEQQNLLLQYPCVVITARGESEEEGDSDFENDAVVYPVLVLIADVPSPTLSKSDYFAWKRAIAGALRGLVAYPLLPNCPELDDVRLSNLPALPEHVPDGGEGKGHYVTGLVAHCYCHEPRQRNG